MKDLTYVFYEQDVFNVSLCEVLKKEDFAIAILGYPKNYDLDIRNVINFWEIVVVILLNLYPDGISRQKVILSAIILAEVIAYYVYHFKDASPFSKKYKKLNERLTLALKENGIILDSIDDLCYVSFQTDIRSLPNKLHNRVTYYFFEDLKKELHVLKEISTKNYALSSCSNLVLLEQEDIEQDEDVQRLCRDFQKNQFKRKKKNKYYDANKKIWKK